MPGQGMSSTGGVGGDYVPNKGPAPRIPQPGDPDYLSWLVGQMGQPGMDPNDFYNYFALMRSEGSGGPNSGVNFGPYGLPTGNALYGGSGSGGVPGGPMPPPSSAGSAPASRPPSTSGAPPAGASQQPSGGGSKPEDKPEDKPKEDKPGSKPPTTGLPFGSGGLGWPGWFPPPGQPGSGGWQGWNEGMGPGGGTVPPPSGGAGGLGGMGGIPGAPESMGGKPGAPGIPGMPEGGVGGGLGGGASAPGGIPGAPESMGGAPGLPGIPGMPPSGVGGGLGMGAPAPGGIPGMPPGGIPGFVPGYPGGQYGGGGPSAPPDRNPPKPQTGGPGAPAPSWGDILGPGGGIPPAGQPYSAGGGFPGMGMGGGPGAYGSNVPLPGQAISDADKAEVRKRLEQTAKEFQAAQDAANRANEARYQQGLGVLTGLSNSQDQALGGLGGLYGQMVNQYGQGAGNVIGGLGNAFSEWASNSANVGRGYDNLNADIQNRIAQLGQTQTTDINEAAQQLLAKQNQDLVNRGLGNTTIRASTGRGVEYDRMRELQAMKEGLLNQANQADLSTRLPELSFGQQQTNFGAGLRNQNAQTQLGAIGNVANLQGQGLQFGERANQARNQLGMATADFITARQDQGPDFNTMAGLYSQIANGGYGWAALPSMPAPGTGTNSPVPAPDLPYYNQPQQPATGGPVATRPKPGTTARFQPYATVM